MIVEYYSNIFTRNIVYDLPRCQKYIFRQKTLFSKITSGIVNIRFCMSCMVLLLTLGHIIHHRLRLETEPSLHHIHYYHSAISSGEFSQPRFSSYYIISNFSGENTLHHFSCGPKYINSLHCLSYIIAKLKSPIIMNR